MLRIFINLIILAVGVLVVFYIMPDSLKEKALALLSAIIPDVIEKKIEGKLEPIIYTPTERRAKLLDKLDTNLKEVKSIISKENIQANAKQIIEKIAESEEIISKIEKTNDDPGTINKVTTSIIKKAADALIPKTSETPYIIQNQNPTCSCGN